MRITVLGAGAWGASLAKVLHENGNGVTLWDINAASLELAKNQLAPDVSTVVVDVGDSASVAAAVQQTQLTHKTIDALVNSAGITGPNVKLWDYPPDAWQQVMQVNLNGVFHCCRAVVPVMRAQNYGRIVKITETEVVFREIVQDAVGEWIERTATLQLQERAK